MILCRINMEVKPIIMLIALSGSLLVIYEGCSASTAIYNQICHNCWSTADCTVHYNYTNETWPITLETDCWDMCRNTTDCKVAELDKSDYCWLYNCSQISQEVGYKTSRQTNNSDCLEYELYIHSGYEGNCTVAAAYGAVNNTEECLEYCLETPSCRGITYNETLSTCNQHNSWCSSMQTTTNSMFIQRYCLDGQTACIRNYTQTCVHCSATYECLSQLSSKHERKPLTINTSVIGYDPDVNQIWFDASGSAYKYFQCLYVTQSIGDTVFRAACTQDCPKFEIRSLPGHSGVCSQIHYLTGGVKMMFCLSKCLDTEGCRGVTIDYSEYSCTFHTCDNYTRAEGYTFMARHCLEGPECAANSMIVQTCIGCNPGPDCPLRYTTGTDFALYTSCSDIKGSDNESVIVHYRRHRSQCNRLQCSQVKQRMGHILYRQSCNTDCPKFEIFQLDDYGGSCQIIHSEEGGLTFPYCVEKCLDISGCRGTTFNETTGRCDYHTCMNHTTLLGVRFMWKRCIYAEPQREYQQICAGCKISDSCQMFVNTSYLTTWQDCEAYFNDSTVSDMYIYDTNTSTCGLINCTFVEQDENMYLTVFRKSPSSDCPIFRLFTLYGYNGTCPIIGYDEGGVGLVYCIDKCLDMDGCRSVSYDQDQLKCFYHNCAERADAHANSTFLRRECLTYQEFDPVKSYSQTCKNCQNTCHATLSTQIDMHVTNDCNITCTDCASVLYDPSSDQCLQYQCDRPDIQGQGTAVIRKTTNPDCLDFEIITKLTSLPNCVAFEYDEGVSSTEFCIMRCLDIQRCGSLLFDPEIRNCTYHECTDYVLENTLGILFVKNCSSGCASPVTQTCLNCQPGSLCQTPFHSTSTVSRDSCQALCDTEALCEGAVYDSNSSDCKLYQCSFVTQQYGSTFYRDSCNNDCPIYEMYILDGYKGDCEVISVMTEYMVLYPEICYQHCLNTLGCKGVTYSPSQQMCSFHTCDCYKHSTEQPGEIFMWKYCLNDVTNFTQINSSLNNSIITGADIYPSATNCKPDPIFIMPCLCSTGAFSHLTNEEIVLQLIKNLTIDVKLTSAQRRRYISAEDNRAVAVAVGTFGLSIFVSVIATVFAMDLVKFGKTLRHVYSRILKLKRIIGKGKCPSKNVLCSSLKMDQDSEDGRDINPFGTIEEIQHTYAEDIVRSVSATEVNVFTDNYSKGSVHSGEEINLLRHTYTDNILVNNYL